PRISPLRLKTPQFVRYLAISSLGTETAQATARSPGRVRFVPPLTAFLKQSLESQNHVACGNNNQEPFDQKETRVFPDCFDKICAAAARCLCPQRNPNPRCCE